MIPLLGLAAAGVSKSTGIVSTVKGLFGGSRKHTSYTFFDIYGKIQHTNTKAEADAFLAKQRERAAAGKQFSHEKAISSETVARDLGSKAGMFGIATVGAILVIVWLLNRK